MPTGFILRHQSEGHSGRGVELGPQEQRRLLPAACADTFAAPPPARGRVRFAASEG